MNRFRFRESTSPISRLERKCGLALTSADAVLRRYDILLTVTITCLPLNIYHKRHTGTGMSTVQEILIADAGLRMILLSRGRATHAGSLPQQWDFTKLGFRQFSSERDPAFDWEMLVGFDVLKEPVHGGVNYGLAITSEFAVS